MFGRFKKLPDVKSVGKMIFDPVWAQKKHKSWATELIHVLRGNVVVRLGNSRISAGKGDTLLVPEGSFHRDDFDLSVGLEVFMVFFQWRPANEYFRIIPFNSLPQLCAPIADEIGWICDRMQIGVESGTGVDKLMISAFTQIILLLILKEALKLRSIKDTDEHGHPSQAIMLQAKKYIDSHFSEHISLDQIARELRISPFYLSHVFSRESSFSFVEYITQVRMRKAREILVAGAKNVSEAAYAVGYSDSSYFAKVFHRYFGVSPNNARNAAKYKQATLPRD